MLNKKVTNFVFWFLIIALLLACAYIIHFLSAEQAQCLNNAFVYGASKQVTSDDISCSCILHEEGQLKSFNFNNTHWWVNQVDTSFIGVK